LLIYVGNSEKWDAMLLFHFMVYGTEYYHKQMY